MTDTPGAHATGLAYLFDVDGLLHRTNERERIRHAAQPG